MLDEKKIITICTAAIIAIFMTACSASYTVKFGKKCTPDHKEWSYVWFVEKLEDTIDLMRAYFSGVKKSKYFKITRNYSIAKWAKEHKKKYGRKTS